jgi:hypothetical protein
MLMASSVKSLRLLFPPNQIKVSNERNTKHFSHQRVLTAK